MLLQMALFCSFLWLSNVPVCVCVCVRTISSLSVLLLMDIKRLPFLLRFFGKSKINQKFLSFPSVVKNASFI